MKGQRGEVRKEEKQGRRQIGNMYTMELVPFSDIASECRCIPFQPSHLHAACSGKGRGWMEGLARCSSYNARVDIGRMAEPSLHDGQRRLSQCHHVARQQMGQGVPAVRATGQRRGEEGGVEQKGT